MSLPLTLKVEVCTALRKARAPAGYAVVEDGDGVVVHFPGDLPLRWELDTEADGRERRVSKSGLDDCRLILEAGPFTVEPTTWRRQAALRVVRERC